MTRYIMETFAGVETSTAMGYTFFFFGAERKLPFATLATSDNDYDRVSKLDRPGVFRLNIGVSKDTYRSLFNEQPASHDFAALDCIMPHPDYAAQSWLCVLNPGEATLQTVQSLLAEAYDLAVRRQARKRPAEE